MAGLIYFKPRKSNLVMGQSVSIVQLLADYCLFDSMAYLTLFKAESSSYWITLCMLMLLLSYADFSIINSFKNQTAHACGDSYPLKTSLLRWQLLLSVDNLCKQLGHRSGPTKCWAWSEFKLSVTLSWYSWNIFWRRWFWKHAKSMSCIMRRLNKG